MCQKLWRNDVPSKAIKFMCRLLLEKIATHNALHRRGILTSTQDLCCVFCFKETETTSYLFCTCELTKKIWCSVFSWLGKDVSLQIKRFGI